MPFIVPVVAAIGTAIGAVGTFIGGLGVIGTALIGAGVAVASSYIISALAPKPEAAANENAPGGVSFERQYGTNVSRKVACGLVGIAGHDTYINTYDSANKYLQQIYTLSDYYSTELTRVGINGTWAALGSIDADGYTPIISGDFANLIRIRFLDGRQPPGADIQLIAHANPPGRWTMEHMGFGITAVIVQMLYDQDKNNSFPDFFFEFKGAPLYDIRKDSTMGGSGSHRWGDVATYEYSDNPIVMEYNYRRGFVVNGDLFCGMDMIPGDLPFDKYVNAMNICDELTDGDKRYACSIFLDSDATHSDNLKSLALSCGAMQIDGIDGSWPLVGSNQPAVIEFTDADLIDDGDFEYIEKQSMGQLVNSVSGNYPEPSQMWSMIGYEPQISADYIAIDRRTRDVAIDFPQVRNAKQAAKLAWVYLYENRYEVRATVTLRPRFQVIEAGDWINWNSAAFGAKTFIVVGTALQSLESGGPRNVVLTLQQRDGQIYEGIAPPPIVIPTRPGEPVYLEELQSFALIPVSVTGANGVAQPAIRVSWNTIDDVTVSQIDLRYYPVDDTSSVMHKLIPADRTVEVLSSGIVGDTVYRVQARLITEPLRPTVYNAGATVKTLKIGIGLAQFNAELEYQVTKMFAKADARINDIDQIITSVVKNLGGREWNNKQMVQRQLMSVTGTLTASITEVMTVATDTAGALAEYKLTVDAQVDDLYSAIGITATAIATLETSFSEYKTEATASFNDLSAVVTTNSTAIATIDGKLASTWSLALDVNGYVGGLKAYNDGSFASFTIIADIFQVALPSAGAGGAPRTIFTLGTVSGTTQLVLKGDFLADGVATIRIINVGYLSAISANIGDVSAGVIRSSDNGWIMDLTNRTELMSD